MTLQRELYQHRSIRVEVNKSHDRLVRQRSYMTVCCIIIMDVFAVAPFLLMFLMSQSSAGICLVKSTVLHVAQSRSESFNKQSQKSEIHGGLL